MTAKKIEEIKKEVAPVEEIKSGLEIIDDAKHIDAAAQVMPEISQEAVTAAQNKENILPVEPETLSGKLDKIGRSFDSALHLVDSDGRPKITQDGFLMQKRGGAARAKLNIPAGQKSENKTALADLSAQRDAGNRRATAVVTTGLFIQAGVTFFGDEWKPEKTAQEDEFTNLVDVLDNYYKEVGFKQMPPWAVVFMAFGGYAVKRLNKPVTQTKLQKIGGWFKNKGVAVYSWWINRRKPANAKKTIVPDLKIEICSCKGRIDIPLNPAGLCSKCNLKRK